MVILVEKKYTFRLDAIKRLAIPYIEFVQGDTKVNILEIELTRNNEPLDLKGTTIAMIFKKADGNTVIGCAQIIVPERGQIRYKLGTQEIAYPGKANATVQIYGQTGERLTSAEFDYYVREQLDDGQAIESTTEYPILTDLIAELSALKPEGEGKPGQILIKDSDGKIQWDYLTLDNGVIME